MKNLKTFIFFFVLLVAVLLPLSAWAQAGLPHPDTYVPSPNDMSKMKKMTDDPRDLMVTLPLKKALPPEIWDYLATDIKEAKRLAAEILGFKSPDLVGRIAPEIKPGKYTYQDLDKYPGLRKLFPQEMIRHFRPGGPPLVGSIPEFEIIPTQQQYLYTRLWEITKQNLGKTKLDKDGYIVPMSWEGGIPFPRPSGKFKAREVFYSFDKRPSTFEYCIALNGESYGFDKNLKIDKYAKYIANFIRLMGRTQFPPIGWFDERAEKNGEFSAFGNYNLEPRANRGMTIVQFMYDDPQRLDPWLIYIPSLRRIRKMAATDTQDPQGDMAYDDRQHCIQKITPKKYPVKFDIIEEREYLMPISYNTSRVWVDSKNGYAAREVQFMRRPCYVLQMTELEPNYVYSKRIIYIDKENFNACFSANYDQKGRLYRSQLYVYLFLPDMGQMTTYGTPTFQYDHIDDHSTYQMSVPFPAVFTRQDFSIQFMIKKGK